MTRYSLCEGQYTDRQSPLGTLTVDDENVITGYTPAAGSDLDYFTKEYVLPGIGQDFTDFTDTFFPKYSFYRLD